MEASGAEAAAAAAVTAGLMPGGDSWSAVELEDGVVVPVVLGIERCSETEDGVVAGEEADFRAKDGTKEEEKEVLDDGDDEENAVTTGSRAPKM